MSQSLSGLESYLRLVFSQTSDLSEHEKKDSYINVLRNKHPTELKEKKKIKQAVTSGLEVKFGSPKHLLTGKSEDEDRYNWSVENVVEIGQHSEQFNLCFVWSM